MTEALYLENPYLELAEATVTAVGTDGGLYVDRSIFYPQGGGQPGDRGSIEWGTGFRTSIKNAVYSPDRSSIVLIPDEGQELPQLGQTIIQHVDWARRHALMRMHTAMHLLSVVLPYPVTGGQVGTEEGRLDFDLPEGETVEKVSATNALNALIQADHAVITEWITDDELAANPALVKTMKVKPPTGAGRVRLVRIGTDIDLQPCGGTHVKSTGEIGEMHIAKIESKGRINRRVRLHFGPPADAA
ncbi:Alanine--tRNA ligase [Pleomorphomonas sp. T1.2MG-36]|uniref:alanyl-tRNA editing protein n=1 Tax=Pleomorphomonas sp. T1.2MG-36 TaxID=3041167 RepID=UPI002477ABA6|nr:alanyl-tRNA editing protein [Pleomorphomonas sp. T1.2MG-36]CAI9405282.1 Alanine--tRNA ligase [Pleomorphomonas sp. T1.2MG-36]